MSVRVGLTIRGVGLTAGLALLLTALSASAASAATIDVTVTFDDPVVNNGNCSLREAVHASNLNAAVDDCDAGDNAFQDTIRLMNSGPYLLSIPPDGNPDDNNDGDLDTSGQVSIAGQVGTPTINQTATDRIAHAQSGNLDLQDVRLINGDAGIGAGGAVFGDNTTVTISNVVFEDNTAARGGAIRGTSAVKMEDAQFTDNEAALSDGGALSLSDSVNHEVHETSFVDNDALDQGGAIDLRDGGVIEIGNSTFTGNGPSHQGAAIFVENTAAAGSILRDSTLVGNPTDVDGGGALSATQLADLTVSRTIIAGNVDTNGTSNCGTAISGNASSSFNLVGANDCGLAAGASGNLLDVDPQLAPAGVYTAGKNVIAPPFVGSPAVNAIPADSCGPSAFDQHNRPRPDTVGGLCDIGAYEGSVPRPVVTTPNTNTTTTPPTETKQKCKKGKKLKKGKCKKKKRKKKK